MNDILRQAMLGRSFLEKRKESTEHHEIDIGFQPEVMDSQISDVTSEVMKAGKDFFMHK